MCKGSACHSFDSLRGCELFDQGKSKAMAVSSKTRFEHLVAKGVLHAGACLELAPGDGLCLLYCFVKGLGLADSWDGACARSLYVAALDELAQRMQGRRLNPRNEVLASSMVPESDAEMAKHAQWLLEADWPEEILEMDSPWVVLASKLSCLCSEEQVLDSYHYAGWSELQILAELFAVDVMVWGLQESENVWLPQQKQVTDAEGNRFVECSKQVLQLLFNGDHYDLVSIVTESPARRVESMECGSWVGLYQAREVKLLQESLLLRGGKGLLRKRDVEEGGGEQARMEAEGSDGRSTERDESMQEESEAESLETCSSDMEDEPGVDPNKTWQTYEDAQLEQVSRVASLLREHPLIPNWQSCAASGVADEVDVSLGIKLPAAHCALRECYWTSERSPCDEWRHTLQAWILEGCSWRRPHKIGRSSCCGEPTCLWVHLYEAHRDVLESIASEGDVKHVFSIYSAAVAQTEKQSVPVVGWSVDRRALARCAEKLNPKVFGAYICACCARVGCSGDAGEIGYLSAGNLFAQGDVQSFLFSWDAELFRRRFAKDHVGLQDVLQTGDWTRTLVGGRHSGANVVLCPEDIKCDTKHAAAEICLSCRVPICRSCLETYCTGPVPEALCNDNLLGYCPAWMYEVRVRYIEAAAASPLFTALVTFYVEGDFGHVLSEPLHKADHGIAVRGNIASFAMPWEQMYGSMIEALASGNSCKLPHEPEVLARLVQFHLKVGTEKEITSWVPATRLRPFVVLKLLNHLLDRQHPCCAGKDVESLRANFVKRLNELYPETESHLSEAERQGAVPEAVAKAMQEMQKARVSAAPVLLEKMQHLMKEFHFVVRRSRNS